MAILNPPSVNALQKTLAAELLTGVTASATLSNTTNIVNGTGMMVIDRVDANGKSTASKREYISFTAVSGSTVTTLTRNADGGGSDQDHAVGAIVEFIFDVVQGKAIKDTFETEHSTAGVHEDVTLSGSTDFVVEHNTDGTHKGATVTTLKATGAEINTGTEDAKIVTPKAIEDSNFMQAIDEDDMASDLDTKVPTQQSVKKYVDDTTGIFNRAFTWFLEGTQIVANELGAKYIVPQTMTVTKIWWKTGSGTATLRIQKNTTDINASMSATTSVGSDDSITSAALTAGQVITLDVTAVSSGANISVTMECTQ